MKETTEQVQIFIIGAGLITLICMTFLVTDCAKDDSDKWREYYKLQQKTKP